MYNYKIDENEILEFLQDKKKITLLGLVNFIHTKFDVSKSGARMKANRLIKKNIVKRHTNLDVNTELINAILKK